MHPILRRCSSVEYRAVDMRPPRALHDGRLGPLGASTYFRDRTPVLSRKYVGIREPMHPILRRCSSVEYRRGHLHRYRGVRPESRRPAQSLRLQADPRSPAFPAAAERRGGSLTGMVAPGRLTAVRCPWAPCCTVTSRVAGERRPVPGEPDLESLVQMLGLTSHRAPHGEVRKRLSHTVPAQAGCSYRI
jgi:hypothetical protein